jgi:hypothetical protein
MLARERNHSHGKNPDVFGMYEVEGATVFSALVSKMPNYTFQIPRACRPRRFSSGLRSR